MKAEQKADKRLFFIARAHEWYGVTPTLANEAYINMKLCDLDISSALTKLANWLGVQVLHE